MGNLQRFEDSGDWEKSLYVAKQKGVYVSGDENAGGTNAWVADELGNWGLGRFRRLEASEVWKVQDLGNTGNGGKSLYVAKNKNLPKTRRNRKIRSFRKLRKLWGTRRLGRFGKTGEHEIPGIRKTGNNH